MGKWGGSGLSERKAEPGKVFLLGLLTAAAVFLPFVAAGKGMFLYYGDFNVQQIPFYQLAGDALKSGNWRWNWETDLGASLIGSYGFYLLFSPFFWLSMLFPAQAVPYLMGPLLMLKSACAALTAYLWIRRFTRTETYAMCGALLYAYSGFSAYNVFFNHFHEVMVFFPLLLLGLEEAMEGKRFRLAAAVAVNALVNYWFFIGEVFFTALYFLVRFVWNQTRLTGKRFFRLAAECILGFGVSMVGFLPCVLAIVGNPRTGTDALLHGGALWYYANPQRYLGILQAIFCLPDLPALNNIFPDHGAQWSSLAAYLPLFGASGALACCLSNRRNWLSRLLKLSLVLALVPVGNHLFVLENQSYYARWFYMPVLLMALATAQTLERFEENETSLFRGLKWDGIAAAVLLAISGLTPDVRNGKLVLGLYRWRGLFLLSAGLTMLGWAAAWLFFHKASRDNFARKVCALTVAGCVVCTSGMLTAGKLSYPDTRWITEEALPGRNQMAVDSEVFARSDLYHCQDNLGMYWNLPNIQAFHSVVPVSIMKFYPEVGVQRDVSSKPDTRSPELRTLLSVRWLYVPEKEENQPPMPGYVFRETRNGYRIYENEQFLPMGFAYDSYLTEEDWKEIPQERRCRALLKAVYLDEDAIARNEDLLTPVGSELYAALLGSDASALAEERASMGCQSFTVTKEGFSAVSRFEQERLVFFSVPWDSGWKAWVNGVPAKIERANLGFMAVRVPVGRSEIRFVYTTPGLKLGAVISLLSLLLLLLGGLVSFKQPKAQKPFSQPEDFLQEKPQAEETPSTLEREETHDFAAAPKEPEPEEHPTPQPEETRPFAAESIPEEPTSYLSFTREWGEKELYQSVEQAKAERDRLMQELKARMTPTEITEVQPPEPEEPNPTPESESQPAEEAQESPTEEAEKEPEKEPATEEEPSPIQSENHQAAVQHLEALIRSLKKDDEAPQNQEEDSTAPKTEAKVTETP